MSESEQLEFIGQALHLIFGPLVVKFFKNYFYHNLSLELG